MKYQLGVQQRDDIFRKLTSEQQNFIINHIKRRKRTIFANIMAKGKGEFITDKMTDDEIELILDDWIFVDYIDGGVVREDLTCECGRHLRYQYIVKNKKTNQVSRFGIDHFKQHTGLSSDIVKDVVRGFEYIDYELEEICYKIKEGVDGKPEIPSDFSLPSDIVPFYSLDLPLLDQQIKHLKEKLSAFDMERKDLTDPITDFEATFEKDMITNHYVQTDLFGLSTNPNDMPNMSYHNLEIDDKFKKAIDQYLLQGVESARIMTELLIKHHQAPNERYRFSLSRKPKIYPLVAHYIDTLVAEDKYELLETDSTDRRYKSLSPTDLR